MSPRRRTLCFVLIFLSLNNGFVVSCPMGPSVVTEYYPPPCAPPCAPPRVFPGQRFNDFSFGSYPPGLSINTVATTNYGGPNPFPILEPIQEIESVTIQIPSMPPLPLLPPPPPPTITFIPSPPPPPPSPQTIINEVTYAATDNYPQIIETEITTVNCGPPVPPVPVPVPAPCPSLPVTLQINMAPACPEPLSVFSQPAPCSCPFSSFNPSYEMPPPPIIVMEKSKSSLKSILPILLLTMLDGGCGNNCGGGCSSSQCNAPTLVPFPIVVPINSPVTTRGSCKAKGAATTDAKS